MSNNYTLEPDPDFIEEDPRSKVIKDLTDDEEIDASLELLEEKYDESNKDNSSDESESDNTPIEEKPDNSDKPADTPEPEQKPKEDEQPPETDNKFVLTDEVINKQSEDNRKILSNFKGKGKEELAKAAANAIALKNPYLKDNQPAIDAVAAKLLTGTDESIVQTLIDSQKEVGKTPTDEKSVLEPVTKIELPEIPETDQNIQTALNQETIKRLQKKYPTMPDDISSVQYKEWERDLIDTEGLIKTNQFIKDLESTKTGVKSEMQKVLYAANNLKNLYNENPSEILPVLTDENLPRLKQLNDDFININNKALENEVGIIKTELQKYGISETDLGLDLTLTKDQNGSLYNNYLNGLMFNGESLDANLVKRIGKVPLLQKGQLAKKLIYENNPQILTQMNNKRSIEDRKAVEKLKEDNLNTLGGTKTTGVKKDVVDLKKITDDTVLDKKMAELEAKYQ